jgi:hypothetical protein
MALLLQWNCQFCNIYDIKCKKNNNDRARDQLHYRALPFVYKNSLTSLRFLIFFRVYIPLGVEQERERRREREVRARGEEVEEQREKNGEKLVSIRNVMEGDRKRNERDGRTGARNQRRSYTERPPTAF